MPKEWLDSIHMKTSKKLRFNNTSQIIKGKIIGFFFFWLKKAIGILFYLNSEDVLLWPNEKCALHNATSNPMI